MAFELEKTLHFERERERVDRERGEKNPKESKRTLNARREKTDLYVTKRARTGVVQKSFKSGFLFPFLLTAI